MSNRSGGRGQPTRGQPARAQPTGQGPTHQPGAFGQSTSQGQPGSCFENILCCLSDLQTLNPKIKILNFEF